MIRRIALALAFVLLLCVNGYGCAGTDRPELVDDPEAFEGWCCDGVCGFDAEDTYSADVCSCSGVVRPRPGSRGDCIESGDTYQ